MSGFLLYRQTSYMLFLDSLNSRHRRFTWSIWWYYRDNPIFSIQSSLCHLLNLLVSTPVPITLGTIVCISTTPVHHSWYGKLFASSVVFHVRLKWRLVPLVLDLHLLLVSTVGQQKPIFFHMCICTVLFLIHRWCSGFLL